MLQKKKRRLKLIEKKLIELVEQFPNHNLKDLSVKRAYEKHFELIKEKIHLEVSIKFCPSENRNEMCIGCNCWKATASRCG